HDVARIYALGMPLAPVVLSFFLIQSAGVLVLSIYASKADVGVFRLAGSIATLPAYAVSAFTLAWGPLSRSPLQTATDREVGQRTMSGLMALYYVIGVGFTFVVMCAFASTFVRIAPRSYSDAAPLIPILSLIPIA